MCRRQAASSGNGKAEDDVSDKTVLMISYYYPPMAGIGMLRTLKFARYLAELGWHPVVLTPAHGSHPFTCDSAEGDLAGVTVIRTGYYDVPSRFKSLIGLNPNLPVSCQPNVFGRRPPVSKLAKRTLRSAKNVLLFPDAHIGWYRSALREGLAAISRFHPAVIYSSSPPVTAHLVAHRLKRITGTPWVAELRDLWSDNHQNTDLPRWRELLETRVEKVTLSGADGLVTVSDSFANRLSGRLGMMGGKIEVIRNGFDPGDYKNETSGTQKKFIVSHMGDLYGESRDPAPVFHAVSRLVARGVINPELVELNFIGLPRGSSSLSHVGRLAEETGLEKVTTVSGSVNYQESLARQQASTVLLLIEILTERGSWVIPGKLFEHFGAQRPTLALVPKGGEVEQLLDSTGGGQAFDPRTGEAALEATLEAWYLQWRDTGTVVFDGRPEQLKRMTRREGARQLAAYLEKIAPAGQAGYDNYGNTSTIIDNDRQ
jgi:glycosyltransferase involved in cell wall biosynthesis